MSPTPLRALLVEDRPEDAELTLHALRRAGFDPVSYDVVDNERGFVDHLHDDVDVILADYNVPQFGAVPALALMKERGLDIPFIIISGTIGDEEAAAAIRRGADDYLLKDRLGRLGAAVSHAIEQRRLRVAREAAERSLRDSEARKAAILEAALDAIITVDVRGAIVEFNAAAQRIFGFSPDEAIGRRMVDLVVPPAARVAHERAFAGVAAGRPRRVDRVEVEAMRADGSVFPAELSISEVNVPGARLFTGFVRDITERAEAERAIRSAEEKYRSLVEQVPAVVYVAPFGTVGAWRYVSPHIEIALGWTAEEWLADPALWFSSIHPDDRDAVLAEEGRALGSGHPFVSEYRMTRKDGRTVWIRDIASVVPEQEGRPHLLQGLMFEVTQRKEAERALREAEQKYRTIFEQAVVGIGRTSVDGRMLAANPALARLFGYDSVPEMLEEFEHVSEMYADPDRRHDLLEALRQHGEVKGFEFEGRRRDGQTFWISLDARALTGPDGELHGVEAIITDVSERVRVQQQLEQSLEALRRTDEERQLLLAQVVRAQEEERQRIASDIHDDPVQKLVAVAMRLEMFKRRHPDVDSAEFARLTEQVRDATERMRKMMFELMPYSLHSDGLASALRLYLEQQSLEPDSPSYALEDDLDHEPPQELRVILYRLAQEALTNVRKHARAEHVVVALRNAHGTFCLEVRDDGVGFDVASASSANGHIGLLSMRERAQMAGGTVDVLSSPGEGTIVECRVPSELTIRQEEVA